MAEITLPIGSLEPFPRALKPMLATLTYEPFSDPKWLFEPKLDGFRILAFIRKGEVTLVTRNGNDFTGHYPWIAQDLSPHAGSEMVIDGEMAALNDEGLPDFNLMQHSAEIAIRGLRLEGEYPIVYYPFDLLHFDGRSLLRVPLHERKALLRESLSGAPCIFAGGRLDMNQSVDTLPPTIEGEDEMALVTCAHCGSQKRISVVYKGTPSSTNDVLRGALTCKDT